MKDFTDKVVIVTGSSQGIGKALAQQLLMGGARVVLNGRNVERLQACTQAFVDQGFAPLPIAGDIAELEDCRKIIDQTIAHWGRIDLLINNAGVNMRGRIEDTEPDVLPFAMKVNYFGSLYMTRLAIPALKASQGGVLFVSSVAGIHGLPSYAVYSSSKMALRALAESLHTELSEYGVYVGIAYVGLTENENGKTIYDAAGDQVPKETVTAFGLQSIDTVATGILTMVRRRQFRRVFSVLGRFNAIVNRISPPLVQYILSWSYRKQNW